MARRYPAPTEPEPSLEELEEMMNDCFCTATDGCEVEPDGVCPDGHQIGRAHV